MYANGKQRWWCFVCRRPFSWQNKQVKLSREFIWFKQWIKEGSTLHQLSTHSGRSKEKIKILINHFLSCTPPCVNSQLSKVKNLVFDGSFVYKRLTAVVGLLDGQSGKLLKGAYGLKENSLPQMLSFFSALSQQGLEPETCTVDGNPQVIKALRLTWPGIIIQRCLVHVQRQGLMWCRQSPKRPDAKCLRTLFLAVTGIATIQQRDLWIAQLASWEARYGKRIATSRETGWVSSDLRRARSMLINAVPDMFHYLEKAGTPCTTNQAEGYFSRMKDKYHDHRGLSPKKRAAYFQWYFVLKP